MYQRNTKGWFKHIDFILLDLACLQAAFVAAYGLYQSAGLPYRVDTYRSLALLLEVFDIIVILLYGTFSGVRRRGYYREFSKTAKHTVLLLAVTVVYLFAMKAGESYSRVTLFLTFLIYLFLTYAVRIAWKEYLKRTRRERGVRSLLILTTLALAGEAVKKIKKEELSRLHMAGLIITDESLIGTEIGGVPVVADAATADEFICREWVDEVFVLYPTQDKIPWGRLKLLSETGVVLHVSLGGMEGLPAQQCILEKFGGYYVLTATLGSMTRRQAFMKRAMDIAGGLVGCAITGVLFVFLAPAIYRKSPGPIFFAQVRIGKNGKKFKMYKFRSMYMDAEERKKELYAANRVEDGMMFKLDFDPRVIGNEILPDGTEKRGIGDFIRRRSLDEFPQFFNVLKGDMSLVGTRPPTLDEWEKYGLRHRARMAAKPGITGMWQVSGRSDVQDFEEVVRLDVEYISRWNIGMDIRILIKTVKQVISGKGAL